MQPIDHFFRSAHARPDAIALEHGSEILSYSDLARQVRALACGLQTADPEPGSRVGICCSNTAEHVIALLATLAAGKIWVPLFPRNSAGELGRIVDFTDASIVIAEPATLHLVDRGAATRIVADRQGTTNDTTGGMRRIEAGCSPATHIRAAGETQAIKFTGGTTGIPKGVMQPLRAWNTNIVTQIMTWRLHASDAYLACTPITHGASTYILPVLATGGRIILQDRPRPEETLQMLGSGRITVTFVSPTVVYLMQNSGREDALDFSRLRALIYGGGPMRPEAIAAAQELFGPVIASTYGQTEAPQIATAITPVDLLRPDKRASVGQETVLSHVEIVDGDGRLLPPGEIGEIAIRGDLVMSGYWRQPEKTAQTIVDGWLRTGDLGVYDQDRFLSIKGRNKDLIITGGFNVYPNDVEPVIAGHPAVADCAVFGAPDEKWGEAVHAAVALHEGCSASEAEIIAYVKERLGSVKTPKAIRFVATLPRNEYGKLKKQELVRQLPEAR